MGKPHMRKFSSDIADTVEDTVAQLRRDVRRTADDAYDGLARTAMTLSCATEAVAEDLQAKSRRATEQVVRQARNHPVAAAALLIGAAALIVTLVVRREPRGA